MSQLSSMAFGGIIDNIETPKIKSVKSFTPINLDDYDDSETSLSKKTTTPVDVTIVQEQQQEQEQEQQDTSFTDKFQQYQSNLLQNLTSTSQDIFSKAKDAVLSIGKDTTFKPDQLDTTEKTEPEEDDEDEEAEEDEEVEEEARENELELQDESTLIKIHIK